MRKLVLAALVLPFLSVPTASASAPPEVLAWTTSAGAWVSVGGAPATLVVPKALDVDVSPDGTKLAYIEDVPDGSGDPYLTLWKLFVADVDGSHAKDLTPGNNGLNAYAYQPQFSPDGTRISYAWGGGDVFNLRTISVDGGAPEDISSTDQTQMGTWSPDGAFIAAPSPPGGLLVVTPDGSQRARYGDAGTFYGDPAWSPDGTTVLFNTTAYSGGTPTHDLKAYAVATRAVTDLVPGASSAAWTPDGSLFYDISSAGQLERRTALGVLDPTFTPVDGADNPAVGGGSGPAHDGTPPASVTGLTAEGAPSQVTLTSTLPTDADIAGIVVRYEPGATAPASITAGSPGGRSPSGQIVVGRLLPDAEYSFSVFAVDWSGNVSAPTSISATTPHAVRTTYRTSTTKQLVRYGDPVTESARLIREDTGGYVEGARVQLFGHAKGQPDKLLATGRTDHNGLAQFVRRPLAPAYYTLKYNGDGQLQPGTGSEYVGVKYRVVAVLSPHIARRGSVATLTVTVSPAIKGLRVTVAQLLKNKQIGGAIMFLDAHGRCSTTLDTSQHGNERLLLAVLPHGGYTTFETTLGFGVA